jgi:hypothetical protein
MSPVSGSAWEEKENKTGKTVDIFRNYHQCPKDPEIVRALGCSSFCGQLLKLVFVKSAVGGLPA